MRCRFYEIDSPDLPDRPIIRVMYYPEDDVWWASYHFDIGHLVDHLYPSTVRRGIYYTGCDVNVQD
jgi:hypothetical protein